MNTTKYSASAPLSAPAASRPGQVVRVSLILVAAVANLNLSVTNVALPRGEGVAA